MDQQTTQIMLGLVGLSVFCISGFAAVIWTTRDERRLHRERLKALQNAEISKRMYQDYCRRLYLESIELNSHRNAWVSEEKKANRREEYRSVCNDITSTDDEVDAKVIASDDRVVESLKAEVPA